MPPTHRSSRAVTELPLQPRLPACPPARLPACPPPVCCLPKHDSLPAQRTANKRHGARATPMDAGPTAALPSDSSGCPPVQSPHPASDRWTVRPNLAHRPHAPPLPKPALRKRSSSAHTYSCVRLHYFVPRLR
ncbi:hypothetical protein DPSP01_009363 [Paraphaeosphaeria sporulosa]